MLLQVVDLLPDFFGGGLVDLCFKRIIIVQVIEVVFNLLVGFLNEGVELSFREVPAPTVYSLEF